MLTGKINPKKTQALTEGMKRDIGLVGSFNPLQPGVAFLYPPENIRKPKGFLIFSGGIEKQHGALMG